MNPLRLTIASLYFHPEPNGSAPPITDLALWLAEQGEAPRVITARPSYPSRRVFEGYRHGERDSETWRGVEVKRLHHVVTRGNGVAARFLAETSFALAVVKARLREGARAGALISVCPSVFTVLAAPLLRAPGSRHLVIVHDVQSGLGKAVLNGGVGMRVLCALERLALNRADVIVTLSDGMRRVLRDIGVTRPIAVLPPQVDMREITPMPEPDGAPKIVYSGAFGRKQGLEQVLDAAALLRGSGAEARVVLRGQGGIEAMLRARISAECLTNVAIEPLVPRARLNAAFAEGILHLVPQAPEGAEFAVPSKVFSIMSAGRPFVATVTPGAPLARLAETSGAGLCVPPHQPQAFADAIAALLADRERRASMGRAGRAYVEQHADREVVCAEVLRLLRDETPDAACGAQPPQIAA